MYKIIALIFALSFTVSGFAQETNNEFGWDCLLCGERAWSLGAGVGADLNGDYGAITISGDWLPTAEGFGTGVNTYLEAGQYRYDGQTGSAVTIGAEPVLVWNSNRYGTFRIGMGLSLGNTTPNLGTIWNFSSFGGWRKDISEDWYIDASIRHRSHAARLGLQDDKANGGVTLLNFEVGVRF